MKHGILDGVKVLDLSRIISGPYCGMLLASMGADVVKVEKRGEGDTTHSYTPFINGKSLYNFVLNINKRSLELDFRSEKGKEILLQLAEKADVIIENFRPGTLEKMGLDYETVKKINPGIIVTHISGFGQKGPYAQRPGFDAISQAMSGLMSLTGSPDGPPTLSGTYIIDYLTGAYGALATIAALYEKQKNNTGQEIELCLIDSAITTLLIAIPRQILLNETVTRTGNRDKYAAPGNTFKTKNNEWVLCMAGASEEHFQRFVKITNQEFLLEDERFSTGASRLKNADEIEKYVARWIAQHETEELIEIANNAGITCAKVETLADVVKNPQLAYRGKIIGVDDPVMGEVPMQGFPFDFSETPASVRRPAPSLGQHSEIVLKEWLNFNDNQIIELRNNKII